jgi:hypothetical protein
MHDAGVVMGQWRIGWFSSHRRAGYGIGLSKVAWAEIVSIYSTESESSRGGYIRSQHTAPPLKAFNSRLKCLLDCVRLSREQQGKKRNFKTPG